MKAKRILQEPAESESLPDEVRDLVGQAKKLFDVKNYIEAEKIYQKTSRKFPIATSCCPI